jgi:hypothetical protein
MTGLRCLTNGHAALSQEKAESRRRELAELRAHPDLTTT